MSPEDFIKKHIADALVGEGFPAEVARGGRSMALIIIGDALRPAEREVCSLIVFFVAASGLSVRRLWRSVVPERSLGDEVTRAACFNRRRYVPGLCAG